MARLMNVFGIAALMLLGACATYQDEPAADAPSRLGGTSWDLVSFQSMDDAQGTSAPASGRDYTLEFGSDDRLAMQLDCNRGNASYSADDTSEASGSLTIGPVAATRALCPQPDMGEMLARRLPDVASYMIRDGHLFLSLKMDGGIFEFSPR